MKCARVQCSNDALLDHQNAIWSAAISNNFDMFPTPLGMVADASPFLARSVDHGAISKLTASAIHNGNCMAVRLAWACEKHDTIRDLNQFVDGAAILFPLARTAYAVTMGSAGSPVNGWFWRANRKIPFEVVAEGYRSVKRLPVSEKQDLVVASYYQNGEWTVIFRRSLGSGDNKVKLVAAQSSKIAFALWDGGNHERSGRKSFSGEFVDLDLA